MSEAASSKRRHAGIWASLALGLPVPLLFALYSVYLGAVRPEDQHLRNLAGIQAAFLATTLTALLGARSALQDWSVTRRFIARDARNLAWLNLFTFLGPPLYFVAITMLGPSPANWIDLGMTPALTIGAAIVLRKEDQPHGRLANTAVLLASAGILIVMWDVTKQPAVGLAGALGIVIACVSAVGTAGAGVCLSAVQRDHQDVLSPASLLFLRYSIPAVALGVFWLVEGARVGTFGFVLTDSAASFLVALAVLFVVPNYIYVVVLKKKTLMFSGYMWALLPVFGSVAEFISADEPSLTPTVTILVACLILTATVMSDKAETAK